MNFPSPEFDNAVAALCHGTIANEAMAELHELLRINADARDEYLWRVEMHGELTSSRLDFGRTSEVDESDDSLVVNPTRQRGIAAHSRDSESLADTSGFLLRRHFQPAKAVTALLIIVVLAGGLWVRQNSRPTEVEPETIATFTGLHDSRWMDSTTQVSTGDAIRIGQRIELSSGSAELLFHTGARLRIVGPAIVDPRTDNSVFLTLGEVHLVAETPESKGFTVVTPTSKFVDISTAFSARVSPDGLSRLNVSEGEVDVVLEGAKSSPRLSSGESLYVEPGERQIMTRIEEGTGTTAFHFPTIQPPSREDLADQSIGSASIRVVHGKLNFKLGGGTSGPASVLLDGAGQSHQNAPMESAFFDDHTSGSLLIDLGRVVSVSRINSYSWHQHHNKEQHRHRAQQRFTLYGFAGEQLPDLDLRPVKAGWTRIARVNSDRFFGVAEPLDRPAQQACSIAAAQGDIGQFRYLFWEVKHHTFLGELDVFGSPSIEIQD